MEQKRDQISQWGRGRPLGRWLGVITTAAAVLWCRGEEPPPAAAGRFDVKKLVPNLAPEKVGAAAVRLRPAIRLLPANAAGNNGKPQPVEELAPLSGPRSALPWPAGKLSGPFLLTLDDGTRLQGSPESFDDTALVWKWPDAAEPMRFLTPVSGQCRRLTAPPHHAWNDTLKLTGGCGWLKGDVLGLDEKEVVFRAYGEAETRIPRRFVEWFYLSRGKAADCLDAADGLSALATREGTAPANWNVRDGMLWTKSGEAIGSLLSLPDRWRLVCEVVHDPAVSPFAVYMNGVQVGLSTNSPGTCWFRAMAQNSSMGTYDGSRYTSKNFTSPPADAAKIPPGEEAGAAGRYVYEAWFDRSAGEFSLRVNGGSVESLKFSKPPAPADKPRAFSISPMVSSVRTPWLGVRRFLVEPWDGRREKLEPGMELANGTWQAGGIQALDATSATVGGKPISRSQVRFVRLQAASGEIKPTEAGGVLFSDGGFLPVTGLRLANGRVDVESPAAGRTAVLLKHLAAWTLPGKAGRPESNGPRIHFASGEVLFGAFTGGDDKNCGWRLAGNARPAELPWSKLRAVITGVSRPEDQTGAALVLLQSGDFFSASALKLKGDALQFASSSAGDLTWPLADVQSVCPGGAAFCEGGFQPAAWQSGFGDLRPTFASADDGERGRQLQYRFKALFPWDSPPSVPVYDGVFAPTARRSVEISRTVARPPRSFELRFRVRKSASYQAVRVILFGKANGDVMCLNLQDSYGYCQEVRQGEKGPVFPRLQSARRERTVRQAPGTTEYRILVDTGRGVASASLNGNALGTFRGTALRQIHDSGRLGFGISLSVPSTQRVVNGVTEIVANQAILHDVFLLPWDGTTEAPPPGQDHVLLANGDVAPGSIQELSAEAVVLNSEEVGELEIPLSRVASLRKAAGSPAPASQGNFRVRLGDGSAISIESFRCDADSMRIALPGGRALTLPLHQIREIVRLAE